MWKKRRWYIWDSNLGPHDLKDGRRKQINWDIEDSNLLGWSYLLSSEKIDIGSPMELLSAP